MAPTGVRQWPATAWPRSRTDSTPIGSPPPRAGGAGTQQPSATPSTEHPETLGRVAECGNRDSCAGSGRGQPGGGVVVAPCSGGVSVRRPNVAFRPSSSRSSLVKPSRTPASISARLHQSRNDSDDAPSSTAISRIGRPLEWTRATCSTRTGFGSGERWDTRWRRADCCWRRADCSIVRTLPLSRSSSFNTRVGRSGGYASRHRWAPAPGTRSRERSVRGRARRVRERFQAGAGCWISRTRKASTMSLTPRITAKAATQAIRRTALRP
jgi:hypothetical protein